MRCCSYHAVASCPFTVLWFGKSAVERLVLISPEFPEGRVTLHVTQLPAVLGRSRSCDVTIHDPLLSRQHCEIRLNLAGQPELHDLESTNLTIVNEHDIQTHVLQTGDRILLGETEILVQVMVLQDDISEKTTRDLRMLPKPQEHSDPD